nr:MAG TPA: helix-turn-helix XRE-family like protein [Caudoviricetes sp.]
MNERVKELRAALGLTQEEFGKRIGLAKSGISRIESGATGTTEQTLRSMVREFGASYLWLTTGAGSMFENGEEAAVHVMIDRVMAGENEHVKNLFKGLSDWTTEDWQQVDRLLDKLLAGWTPWADGPGGNKKED